MGDSSTNQTSCDYSKSTDDKQDRERGEETVCVFVSLYMCEFVSAGKGGGVVSVALQEQTAIALCGFFSVPLTYKDSSNMRPD